MWSDRESDKDYLNFGEVSQLAADILESEDMRPISLGIYGNWGVGKSSLLKLIESELKQRHQDNDDYIIVNFDAWLYQGYDDSRAALLEVIGTALIKAGKDNQSIIQKGLKLIRKASWLRIAGYAADVAVTTAGIPTGGLIGKLLGSVSNVTDGEITSEDYADARESATQLSEAAPKLIKEEKESPPQRIEALRKEYQEILEELNKPVYVFIDNLDRCLPINAIHTLEAIRLFLFLPQTAFVIAADEGMIRSAVSLYYKEASERHKIDYLDKLIQLPIHVPKAGVLEIRAYLYMLYAIDQKIETNKLNTLRTTLEDSLQTCWQNTFKTADELLNTINIEPPHDQELRNKFNLSDRIAPLLASSPFIHGNPRTVKRLLNVVKMRINIAKRRNITLDEATITKLVIFERCTNSEVTKDFFDMINSENGKPKLVTELETSTDLENLTHPLPDSWKKEINFIKDWIKMEPKLADVDLRPALYLSRETLPIGLTSSTLSQVARNALDTLLRVANKSSPEGKRAVDSLSTDEGALVMEEMVNHFRKISNWESKPEGFSGACLLADKNSHSAKILTGFITGNITSQLPWLKATLKNENWNNGGN